MRGVGWLGRNQRHLQAPDRVSGEGVEREEREGKEGRGRDVLGEAPGPGPPLQPSPGSKTEDGYQGTEKQRREQKAQLLKLQLRG